MIRGVRLRIVCINFSKIELANVQKDNWMKRKLGTTRYNVRND